ncbi:hypothetical protein [Bacillus testis]|uniref:hypothetical protein n=1 Tax=Bacillus testis TaxID=1622072 RepID=UPI00067EDEA3|nr:hypothetical protein [Bacillus testis]
MNSFAAANQHNQDADSNSASTPSLITRLLSNPMRIGLWDEQQLTWEYPQNTDQQNSTLFSVTAMNSTKDYEIIKVQLNNESALKKEVKIIVQYHNVFEKESTAFYSPKENAIICFFENQVTMLGGHLNGKGMSQYCLHDIHACNSLNWLESLRQGYLPLSWLAKGEVVSTFALETELSAHQSLEGVIWSFHSTSEAIVRRLKKETIHKYM